MIRLARDLNLGLDKGRMKNPLDVERQTKTVRTILNRLFPEGPAFPRQVQILADEVGMGKTFVALAVAYSVLRALQGGTPHPDLVHCSHCVLVITPANVSLNRKWRRDVGEFVQRCVNVDRKEARAFFSPQYLSDAEGFPACLSGRRGEGPRVFVTHFGVLRKLKAVAKDLWKGKRVFPLVIVDEAHNWKNHAHGFKEFSEYIAPRTRRLLLMTATPFQLRPEEMMMILEAGDKLASSPDDRRSKELNDSLKRFREDTLTKALDASRRASGSFSEVWARLPGSVSTQNLQDTWSGESLQRAREEFFRMAGEADALTERDVQSMAKRVATDIEPDLAGFMKAALELYAFNCDLSLELGRLVIRHKRHTNHRLVRVGRELQEEADILALRPDRHIMHQAPGIDIEGPAELPHYVLMRCVNLVATESKRNRPGAASLGNNLTGCYSTLLTSSESKNIQERINRSERARIYFNILKSMVSKNQDPEHPKVRSVVDWVTGNWLRGEKTLIFCFRVNTAERLREIIEQRIGTERKRLDAECLNGGNLAKLTRFLSGRNGHLVPILLDRILWSFLWSRQEEKGSCAVSSEDIRLREDDLERLARLSLLFDVPVFGEKADRIFVHRCVEHIIAGRLIRKADPNDSSRSLLEAVSDISWVERPYGLAQVKRRPRLSKEEFDERPVDRIYEPGGEPTRHDVRDMAARLRNVRERTRRLGYIPVVDFYFKGPSLWLGAMPTGPPGAKRGKRPPWRSFLNIHRNLWTLSMDRSGRFDWESRRLCFHALRRSILRQSMLVRLLPGKSERKKSQWGALLVRSVIKHMPGQRESMADKVAAFLEDLASAGGSLSDHDRLEENVRFSIYRSTVLRGREETAALVTGASGAGAGMEHRDRVFTAFNMPFSPEVLVCTRVGQEGIDLHRQCRHVVHYDLAWNPAVVEQRTGRVDRIGSKAFRERDAARGKRGSSGNVENNTGPFLEIGLPYLAATYDERMYEQLRLRSQIFEVLLGGEVAGVDPVGRDYGKSVEGSESDDLRLVPLPHPMVEDLRVKLHVWAPTADTRPKRGE